MDLLDNFTDQLESEHPGLVRTQSLASGWRDSWSEFALKASRHSGRRLRVTKHRAGGFLVEVIQFGAPKEPRVYKALCQWEPGHPLPESAATAVRKLSREILP